MKGFFDISDSLKMANLHVFFFVNDKINKITLNIKESASNIPEIFTVNMHGSYPYIKTGTWV